MLDLTKTLVHYTSIIIERYAPIVGCSSCFADHKKVRLEVGEVKGNEAEDCYYCPTTREKVVITILG